MPPTTPPYNTTHRPPIENLDPYRARLRAYRQNLSQGIATRCSQVLSDAEALLAQIVFLEDKCEARKEDLDAAEAENAELVATVSDHAERIADLQRQVNRFETRGPAPNNTQPSHQGHGEEHGPANRNRLNFNTEGPLRRTTLEYRDLRPDEPPTPRATRHSFRADGQHREGENSGHRANRPTLPNINTGGPRQNSVDRGRLHSGTGGPGGRQTPANPIARFNVPAATPLQVPRRGTPGSLHYRGREYIPSAGLVRRPRRRESQARAEDVVNDHVTRAGNGGNSNVAPMTPFGGNTTPYGYGAYSTPYGALPYWYGGYPNP